MLRKKEKAHKQKRKEDKSTSFRLFFLFFTVLIFSCFCNLNYVSAEEVKPSSADVFSTSLDGIEEKVFRIKYSNDKKEDRLSRLEDFIFGTKNESKTPEERLKKISSSIEAKPEPIVKKEIIPTPIEHPQIPQAKEEPKTVYDENTKNGVFGTITDIEKKIFNRTFEDMPFQQRVEQLEMKMLSKGELNKVKGQPLLERVTNLVQKGNPKPIIEEPFQVIKPKTPAPQANRQLNGQRNYRIDPNTGQIVNELTGDVVTDSDGNPITVRIPTQIPQQQQYFQDQEDGYPIPGFGGQQQFPGYGAQQQFQQNGFPNQLQQQYGGQNPLNQLNNFPIDPNY